MDGTNPNKLDSLDMTNSLIPSTPLNFPGNVTMCYPPQPSPLSDGNQPTGSYLVPPSMTSPSSCLAIPTQQMYSNYPSPYYRSMLGSQQSYYGSILPTAGPHSSAFYGTFYNPNSPSVYSGTGQPSINPMNYYSSSLYMPNPETMWNSTAHQTHTSKRQYSYDSETPSLQPCSKDIAATSSLPQELDDPVPEQAALVSLVEPPHSGTSAQVTNEESGFQFEDLERRVSKAESVDSTGSSSSSARSKESLPLDSDEDSAEEEKEDSLYSYSSVSSCESYSSEEALLVPNENDMDPITEETGQDTSFGDIQCSKEDLICDEDLQCLLCKNFDHLIPRSDIGIKLEPVVGEHISISSVLLCTQCDLMLERYLSLEKEVQHLQLQIQSMYQNNKQSMTSLKEIDEYCHAATSHQDLCLDGSYASGTMTEVESESLHIPSSPANHRSPSAISTLHNSRMILAPMSDSQLNPCNILIENSTKDNVPEELTSHNQCEECGRSYADRKSLQRHMKSHSYQEHCDVCDESFDSKAAWKKHQRLHDEKEPIKCKECNQEFTQRSHYVYHFKVKHGPRDFKCNICDKEFVSSGPLKTHMRIHTGEKPYVCQSCGRGFNVNSNLLAHVPKCTGQLPFKCEECGKGFASKSLFQVHVKAHQGEFAMKCDECGMGFVKKSHLIAHQRIHTKEKPYQCPVCNKSFASLGNCNSHVKTHTNDRKFVCEICGKKFARRQALETHLNRHTGNKPFSCPFPNCDKAFHDPSNLINHKKTHKKENS